MEKERTCEYSLPQGRSLKVFFYMRARSKGLSYLGYDATFK